MPPGGQTDDAASELAVGKPSQFGSKGQTGIKAYIRVGVHIQDIINAVSHPEVDTAIVAASRRCICNRQL